MTLTPPNLDDRTWDQLVKECKRRIPLLCPSWTDLGDSDPGITLLHLFAYLTETMIYRLNRIPQKVYIELLNLLGVKLAPPQSAVVSLRFSIEAAATKAIVIPSGTRVAVGRPASGSDVVFVTDRAAKIAAGETFVEVSAHHYEEIAAELLCVATGEAGLTGRVARPPIIAASTDEPNLKVGVETPAQDDDERVPSILHEGRRFRIWREVPSFSNLTGDRHVFLLDRTNGTIQFAPAARVLSDGELSSAPEPLADVPPPGREIRVWYRRGGGAIGNAAPGTIDTLRDSLPQVRVINPGAAVGGRDAESLDNALIRGPQEIRSHERAVTADDFESLAIQKSGGVARAKAGAPAQHWIYATPGSVEVLLVPSVPGSDSPEFRVSLDQLRSAQSEDLRREIQLLLQERIPLGTTCAVKWARYKKVAVIARIVVFRQEDAHAVQSRLLARVHQAFSPLPRSGKHQGWAFGETLRVFHVHDCAIAEPGVKFVDRVRFRVDELPDRDVTTLLLDPFQPATWYAASGEILYRTVNDGDGWEPAGRFPGQPVKTAAAHLGRAGLLATVTQVPGDSIDTRIWLSRDCAEYWFERAKLDSAVRSIAWTDRDGEPVLLMASDAGLYLLTLDQSKGPALIDISNEKGEALIPIAVAAGTNSQGETCVAILASNRGGVWLSRNAAKKDSFRLIGLESIDARLLRVQGEGSRSFLWAATYSSGGDEGTGCYRWELTMGDDPPGGFQALAKGWKGGSCLDLTFAQGEAFAATHHGGVLHFDTRQSSSAWQATPINAGLPLRSGEATPGREGLAPVTSVAAQLFSGLVMAGGAQGVYFSDNHGESYRAIAVQETEQVTLPPAWLFCPGEHELEVLREDEIR